MATSLRCGVYYWVAEVGFKLVQLLPITNRADNSPYNAISAMRRSQRRAPCAKLAADLTREDFDASLADIDLPVCVLAA